MPERNLDMHRVTRRLGERLVSDGILNDEQLRSALERQRTHGEFLGESLVAMGMVTPAKIGPYLEKVTGFPFVDLSSVDPDLDLARSIPEAFARAKVVLPYERSNGTIFVAMADPLNVAVVDELRALMDGRIEPHLAFAADISGTVQRAFDVRHKTRSVLEQIAQQGTVEITEDDLAGLASDAPIVRLVNSIIQGALSAGASDIHIEPQEVQVLVRYRVDGLLYEQMTIPRNHLAATVSRLKILSSLDIAERRRPQDGRFSVRGDSGAEYDIRLSIMPTVHGEKAVMRLLEKASALGSLDKLGFLPEQRVAFDRFIHRPHGILLVTGPTGSGKSTTLYAALQAILSPTININTIEDPVEYRLQGVNQVQVNPKIGLTFATGLRMFVRQDPDVILVGEIRDQETAEIAVQAALTGHLVLSTLHTNDAPGALVRLQNMGIEPFLISSAVIGVVGQRLLRTLCPACREAVPATRSQMEVLDRAAEGDEVPLVGVGRGCQRCGGRGSRGRTAVYELMQMTESMRDLVLAGAPGHALSEQAIADGMITMKESAMRKVLDLEVAPEEIVRVLISEE